MRPPRHHLPDAVDARVDFADKHILRLNGLLGGANVASKKKFRPASWK
jgi:hypothetical protein